MTTSTTQTIEQAVAALFEAYDYQRVTVAFIIAQGRVAADQACVLMTAKLATMPDDMRAEWKATGPLQQLRNACRRLNLNWSFTSSKKGPILTCDRAITAIVQPAAKPPVSPDSKPSATTEPASTPSATPSDALESEIIRELRSMLSATQAELSQTSAKLATAKLENGIIIQKLQAMQVRAESAELALSNSLILGDSLNKRVNSLEFELNALGETNDQLRHDLAESRAHSALVPTSLTGKRNKREHARANA